MGDVAIRAEDLSKRYRIGSGLHYGRLTESLWNAMRKPLRHLRRGQASRSPNWPREIWALKELSVEVSEGEVVGVVGRNGAGKTTLLKILSRITEPTEGYAEIRGRVGSLLEVGTGFHPELTGRENIYLNGAILGMRRAEINEKFDEIVDFAEVAPFIDTPVKRFSTGMQMRLAFAVAAHLDPEILLVDEVLAVGDIGFQRRSLGRMEEVAREGRTVVFVSHNMPAVGRLCSRALWIDQGRLRFDGPADETIRRYLESTVKEEGQAEVPADPERTMRLREIAVLDPSGEPSDRVEISQPVTIQVTYDINREVSGAHVIVFVNTVDGINVLGTGDADLDAERLGTRKTGRYTGTVRLPAFLLGEGRYALTVSMGIPYVRAYDRHENVVGFEVFDASSRRRQWQHIRRPGLLGLELPWTVTPEASEEALP